MKTYPACKIFQIFQTFKYLAQKNIFFVCEIQTGDHPSPAKLIERRELCLEKLGRFNEEIQVLEKIVEDLSKDGDLRNSEIIAENEEKIKQLLIAGDENLIEVQTSVSQLSLRGSLGCHREPPFQEQASCKRVNCNNVVSIEFFSIKYS